MRILIDGYNLLHVSGLLPRGLGPRTLERARLALLNQIAAALSSEDSGETTIVFDAKDAPRDLPRHVEHRGLQVQFARDFEEADDLLEFLIRTHSAPRQLLVVSSDHRVQRAARRRRSSVRDSELWWADLHRVLPRPSAAKAPPERLGEKPATELSSSQVATWMETFGYGDLFNEESLGEGEEELAEEGESDQVEPPLVVPDSTTDSRASSTASPSSAATPLPATDRRKTKRSADPPPPHAAPENQRKPRRLSEDLGNSPFPSEYLAELEDLEDKF